MNYKSKFDICQILIIGIGIVVLFVAIYTNMSNALFEGTVVLKRMDPYYIRHSKTGKEIATDIIYSISVSDGTKQDVWYVTEETYNKVNTGDTVTIR